MVFHVHKTPLCIQIHDTGSNLQNLLVWSYEVGAIAATVFHSGVSDFLTTTEPVWNKAWGYTPSVLARDHIRLSFSFSFVKFIQTYRENK